MKFALANGRVSKSNAPSIPLLAGLLFLCLGLALAADYKSGKAPSWQKCRGLHAGIRAELVRQEPSVTHPAYVMLTFVLLNDGEASIDVAAETWALAIDDTELKDSGMIFGNGPMPPEGWKTLKPGDHYEFGKGLELTKYFTHAGEYKICWRGKNFESPTITVKIDTSDLGNS
jgi:hypothetical protein